MERSLVTMEHISAWLTEKVCAVEDCEGTTVTVQYRLHQPDDEGCNWAPDVVFNPGLNASPEGIEQHLRYLVPEARRRFNVK